MRLMFIVCSVLISPLLLSQVGVNTPNPDPSAALDIVAKASDKGVLIPRVPLQSVTDVSTVPNPAVSLLVYNTTTNSVITKGYYYWDGSKWLRFNDSSKIFYGNSDPAIPTTNSTGDIFVNNSTGTLFVYNGSNWISQMSGTEILSVKIIATDGQTEFPTPWNVSSSNTKVYRNGVNIDFQVLSSFNIKLEPGVSCYANDEIKIYKFL
ncbi:hypothetical protein QX233_15980 [Chryseobacterium gambrini]|uniref:Uncharacterized protein n=2 Tax=Chryseobacterium group TaxID=2782232 RepID=A0AAJ1R9I8_9FLAO|nr:MULTISPECIES: hypothetical protein [Chryseobacterium]MDN4013973.1 hypothetical protein [Chryseobacterium gambrini]QWA38345.1 hypothetical protein KKI44_21130 [Chryseobacterium sp. ZHDP1]